MYVENFWKTHDTYGRGLGSQEQEKNEVFFSFFFFISLSYDNREKEEAQNTFQTAHLQYFQTIYHSLLIPEQHERLLLSSAILCHFLS